MSLNIITVIDCHGQQTLLTVNSTMLRSATKMQARTLAFTISINGHITVDSEKLESDDRDFYWFAKIMANHGIALPVAFIDALNAEPVEGMEKTWPSHVVSDLEKHLLMSGFVQAPFHKNGHEVGSWQLVATQKAQADLGFYRCIYSENTYVYLPLKLTDFNEKSDSFIATSDEQLSQIVKTAYAELASRLGFKADADFNQQLVELVGFQPPVAA